MDARFCTEWREGFRLALVLSVALSCSAAYGEVIYRWVDENGRTHFTDTAPRQPEKSVTRIDSRQYESSPEQRREAKARAAREKAQADALAGRRDKQAMAPALPAQPAPQAGNPAARPLPPATDATDCDSLLQRFWESSACYAPFLNVNGSMKPGGPETCGPPVPYPAKECS